MAEWYEKLGPPQTSKVGRLEVCRGLAEGRWLVRAYVADRETAEAVLKRWRREYPNQVQRILQDGEQFEDELRRLSRLKRERAERETRYFERLADEALAEGNVEAEDRYRQFAAQFDVRNPGRAAQGS